MPDVDRMKQTAALADALHGAFSQLGAILPPAARTPIADSLYQLGVRVHPDLATKELSEPQGVVQAGNWRPRLIQNITRRDPMAVVTQFNPDLAQRIAAASTEEERIAIREEIRHKHGSKIAAIADQISRLDEDQK